MCDCTTASAMRSVVLAHNGELSRMDSVLRDGCVISLAPAPQMIGAVMELAAASE